MPPVTGKRKSDDAPGTPPAKRARINKAQRQALIDNLQLEITERARKLRAQYALQANDLRARIERRVNRIPVSLRKVNMGELLDKHNADAQKARENASQPKKPVANARGARNAANISVDVEAGKPAAAAAPARKGRKPSHEGMYHDKENAPAGEPLETLKNPKRRVNAAAAGPSRVVSQDVGGANSRVLSPKSLNSRTYPHSPLRGSPDKFQHQGHFSRPVSPVKASSPLRETDNARVRTTKTTASTTKGTKAPTKKPVSRPPAAGKTAPRSPGPRPATRQGERKLSTSTVSSAASSGTTVVKGTRTGATGVRKPTASSNAAAKKTATARTQAPATKETTTSAPAPAPVTGKRTLRKRV